MLYCSQRQQEEEETRYTYTRHDWCMVCLRLPIDYRCKDGPFLLSASCVTFSNPDLHSSNDTARG
jgi:hypothetical protein